jgi:hypothetical protein
LFSLTLTKRSFDSARSASVPLPCIQPPGKSTQVPVIVLPLNVPTNTLTTRGRASRLQ